MHYDLKNVFNKTIPISFIALFRVVFLSWYLIRVIQTLESNYYDLLYRSPYNPIPLFEHFLINRISANTYFFLSAILVVSLLISIEGRWARFSLPFVAVTSFILIGTSLGYYKAANNPYVPHSQNVLMLFLILLAVSPKSFHMPVSLALRDIFNRFKYKSASSQVAPVFHLLPFKLVLGVSYFGAAYVRFKTNGFGWLDGFTLQGYLYDRYVLIDLTSALFLAQRHRLCQLISILLNVFEFSFFMTCLSTRIFLLGSLIAIALHFGIYYFMGINFLNWHLLNFSIVLPEILLLSVKHQQAYLVNSIKS